MNNINAILELGEIYILYLIYFYLMNKTSEKKGFKYWYTLNNCFIFLSSILLVVISRYIGLYTFFFDFANLMLYSFLFYRNTIKRQVVNIFTFYLVRYLSIYSNYLIFTVIIDSVHIDLTYYTNLLIDILLMAIASLILFIITKQLLTKILINDGNEFTNNQFAILLFPSIVGFISLYLFTIYPVEPDDFYTSSTLAILLTLGIVCAVFMLVYLANIKVLNAQEKSLSLLREKRRLEESIEIQYNCFQAIQNAQQKSTDNSSR